MNKATGVTNPNRKKQLVLDVGERNQYDMVQAEVRRNNDLLTTLRRENKELRIAQQQAMRGQHNINVDDHYKKAEDLLHNKMCILKRSLNAVKGKNVALAKEIEQVNEETNFTQAETVVGGDENSSLARKIRDLENRLDKCFIKHNEVNAIRRTYETLLERLQLEQSGFDTRIGATDRALQNSKRELEELTSVGVRAARERDSARADVAQLRSQLAEERANQERDLEQRRGFINTKRDTLERKYNALLVKMAQQEERHAKLQQSITAGGGGTGSMMGNPNSTRSASRKRTAGGGAANGVGGDAGDRVDEIAQLQKQKESYHKLLETTVGSANNYNSNNNNNNNTVMSNNMSGMAGNNSIIGNNNNTQMWGSMNANNSPSAAAAGGGSVSPMTMNASATSHNNNNNMGNTNAPGDAKAPSGVAAVIDAILARRTSNQTLQENVTELQVQTVTLQSELTELQREWDDIQRSSVGRVMGQAGGGGSASTHTGLGEEKVGIDDGSAGGDHVDGEHAGRMDKDNTIMSSSPLSELRRDAAHKESRLREEFSAHLKLRQDELAGTQKHYDNLTHLLQHVGVGVRGLAQKLGVEHIPPVGMSVGGGEEDEEDVEIIVKRPPPGQGTKNNHNRNDDAACASKKALQQRQHRMIARESDTLKRLLNACALRLSEMQSSVTVAELCRVAEMLRKARIVMPKTNTRVSTVMMMTDGGYGLSPGEQPLLGVDNSAARMVSPEGYDVLTDRDGHMYGGADATDSEECGNDGMQGKKGGAMMMMTAGGAGMNAVYLMNKNNSAIGGGGMVDEFTDSEIHNRAELKMMSLATVEREVKKARKQQQQQQQQQRHKEEGM